MDKGQEAFWNKMSELWVSSLENYGQCLLTPATGRWVEDSERHNKKLNRPQRVEHGTLSKIKTEG